MPPKDEHNPALWLTIGRMAESDARNTKIQEGIEKEMHSLRRDCAANSAKLDAILAQSKAQSSTLKNILLELGKLSGMFAGALAAVLAIMKAMGKI